MAGMLVALSGLMASMAEAGNASDVSGSPVERACQFQAAFGCAQFAVHVAAIGSYVLFFAQRASQRCQGEPLLDEEVEGTETRAQSTKGRSRDGALALYVVCGGLMFTCAYLGNTLSIAYFGLSVGFPCSQLSLVLSSTWGIILFKEVQGSVRIAMMVVSAIVMVLGALLLTISKG